MPCFCDTCIATGKSLVASGGKKTSTAFFWNGGLGAWCPISTMCNYVISDDWTWGTHLCADSGPNGERKQLAWLCCTFLLNTGERCSVAFYGLWNTSFNWVKLHGSFDLEGRLTRLTGSGVRRDPNEDKPCLIRRDAIVDDLISSERSVSVEDLNLLSRQSTPIVNRKSPWRAPLDPLWPSNDGLLARWPSPTYYPKPMSRKWHPHSSDASRA